MKATSVYGVSDIPFKVIADFNYRMKLLGNKRRAKIPLVALLLSKLTDEAIFPVVRLLIPSQDKVRPHYRIKNHTFITLLIKALGISPKSDDANFLRDWKGKRGGFYSVVQTVARKRLHLNKGKAALAKLSIGQVNQYLDELSKVEDMEDKQIVFSKLIKNISVEEIVSITKIILRKNLVPFSIVFKVIHPQANSVYAYSMNLEKVCKMYRNAKANTFGQVEIFVPIRPMLALGSKAAKLASTVDWSKHIIERKYDGERIQIHKKGKKIILFSKNGNNYTHTYSSLIRDVLKSTKGVKSCVLDCEIVAYDKTSGKHQKFSYVKRRATMAKKSGSLATGDLKFMVFDIVYLEGKDLTRESLIARKEKLGRVVKSFPKIEVVPHVTISKFEELDPLIKETIEKGEEGLVIKYIHSTYLPGKRDRAWIKVKPYLMAGLGDTLDVVIVGGFNSKSDGRREGVTSFLCAVLDNDGNYATFCKAATGLSDEERKDLQEELEEDWEEVKVDGKNTIPDNIVLSDSAEIPDFWIDPENSRVITVKGESLLSSGKYGSGYTLRFPTIESVRFDKDSTQIVTLKELIKLDEESGTMLASGTIKPADAKKAKAAIAKRARRKHLRRKPTLHPSFKPASVKDLEILSNVLIGKTVAVINENILTFEKHRLEKMVHIMGGKFVQSTYAGVDYVIADENSVKVKVAKKYATVVRSSWLDQCLLQKRLVETGPHVVGTPENESITRILTHVPAMVPGIQDGNNATLMVPRRKRRGYRPMLQSRRNFERRS